MLDNLLRKEPPNICVAAARYVSWPQRMAHTESELYLGALKAKNSSL